MATKLILKDCQIVVNGVNFSDHVSSVELMLSKKQIETTNFAGGGAEAQAGLKGDTITLDFQQDFAAASVDATLWPLYNGETEFTVTVNPHTAANSVTNPAYSATCILLDYSPLAGKVGDLSTTKVKFLTQRTGISRATS